MDRDGKTEPATERRRSDVRSKGRVAKSEDIPRALMLLTALVAIYAMGPTMWGSLQELFRTTMGNLNQGEFTTGSAQNLLVKSFVRGFMPMLPSIVGCMVVVVGANVGQVGFLITPKALEPSLSAFNVVKGVGKFLSLKSLVKVLSSVLKMSIILLVGYITLRQFFPRVIRLSSATPITMKDTICDATMQLGVRVSLLMLIIAAADYFYQKWQHERDLRMTKEEVKEDHKMSAGNPEVKQRIRQVQMQMSRNRMLQDVQDADVIVRNPTHYAVALKYDPEKSTAPIVLAKGKGHMAKRILVLAKKHGVPTRRDIPLAQALYKTCKVGESIPPKLFRVVAKLLVQIFKLQGKAVPA
jgi:flagellar biosynthesis protein FlhB